TGSFVMRAERVGGDTLLARIVAMVAAAQRSRAPIQKLADTVSGWFVPALVLIAAATFIAWSLLGPPPAMGFALVNAIAVLIVAGAEERGLTLAAPSEFHAEPGKGAFGVVEGRQVAVGNAALLSSLGIDPDGLPERADELRRDGHGAMLVAINGQAAGLLAVADPIKPNARETLAALLAEGIRVVMLTGDSRVT